MRDPDGWPLVERYGTGFTETAILRAPDGSGHRWLRSAGPQRADAVRPPSPALAARLREPAGTGLALSLPEAEGPRLVFAADGGESLANLLMTRPRGDSYGPAATLLEELGRTLRTVNSLPAGELVRERHRGMSRLSEWMAGDGKGTDHSVKLHGMARRVLGDERWSLLEHWCHGFLGTGPEDARVLHGKPGTGLVVPDRADGTGVLLIGEDMAAGPPCLDAGWVLGELAELRGVVLAAAGRRDAEEWSLLGRAFVRGYGEPLPDGTGPAATLGILTHLRDYCEFVGWDDWWVPTVLGIVRDECDRDGSGTLEWNSVP